MERSGFDRLNLEDTVIQSLKATHAAGRYLLVNTYVCMDCMTRYKTFSLPDDIADRLEDEDNQSGTVAKALSEHFEEV